MENSQTSDSPVRVKIDGASEKLNTLVENYLRLEHIAKHREAIERLVKEQNVKLLEELISKRLTFGTAGIRGQMGPGFARMNDLVVIQTAQGIASYLLDTSGDKVKESGVIIGHDARHNSSRFAALASLAFLEKGIRVYFSDHLVPTPVIAFGVRRYSCAAGLMVTASHNPKDDNGIKLYWHNGAQILSPHDSLIQEYILKKENQEPWQKAWEHQLVSSDSLPPIWAGRLVRCYGNITKQYFSYIENLVGSDERRQANQASKISITYTPMHGVGHLFMTRALEIAGFDDIFPVEAQRKPDPDFSTVKFPNPEEAGALNLAFETAKLSNSNLILANDPDSDRCVAALFEPSSGRKRILNGNEIGAILGWWLWHNYITNGSSGSDNETRTTVIVENTAKEHQERIANKLVTRIASPKRSSDDCYMISTAVSSKFLQSMARVEGFNFVETLTGFKYMGNLVDELINKRGKYVVFAYEEALGYMVDPVIFDKDGISAAIQLAQCAAFVSSTYGRTMDQQLDWLYQQYGYHFSINSYYFCTDQPLIEKIFRDIQSNYPKTFKTYEVKRVRDLNSGYDSSTKDKKPTLPCSTSSFMVTFFIDTDITLTFRTSGTEPKIKYYSEIVTQLSGTNSEHNHDTEKLAARQRLASLVEAAIEACLRPNEFNLIPADST